MAHNLTAVDIANLRNGPDRWVLYVCAVERHSTQYSITGLDEKAGKLG
jgi:aspartate 1-decarboxylase